MNRKISWYFKTNRWLDEINAPWCSNTKDKIRFFSFIVGGKNRVALTLMVHGNRLVCHEDSLIFIVLPIDQCLLCLVFFTFWSRTRFIMLFAPNTLVTILTYFYSFRNVRADSSYVSFVHHRNWRLFIFFSCQQFDDVIEREITTVDLPSWNLRKFCCTFK